MLVVISSTMLGVSQLPDIIVLTLVRSKLVSPFVRGIAVSMVKG